MTQSAPSKDLGRFFQVTQKWMDAGQPDWLDAGSLQVSFSPYYGLCENYFNYIYAIQGTWTLATNELNRYFAACGLNPIYPFNHCPESFSLEATHSVLYQNLSRVAFIRTAAHLTTIRYGDFT